MENYLTVERVPCCICNHTGKVSKWLVFKRDCYVCDGTGKRRIIVDSRFDDNIKAQLRHSAIYGLDGFNNIADPYSFGATNGIARILGL